MITHINKLQKAFSVAYVESVFIRMVKSRQQPQFKAVISHANCFEGQRRT